MICLGDAKFTKINKIEKTFYNDYVYDLSIEKNHNFLAGEYGHLLISNSIYPDCRKEFIESMNKTIQLSSDGKVQVVAPFIDIDKADICKIGLDLKVPYESTWTCYEGDSIACGQCGACVERVSSS